MGEVLGALAGFIAALPKLFQLYDWLRNQFGDNWEKFLTDVKAVTELVNETKDDALSMDQKRAKRREAILAGRNLWNRIN